MSQKSDTTNKKPNAYQKIVNQLTGIFLPILNCLTAASIIKSLVVLLAGAGVLQTDGGIYRIFYAMSDGFFYFLPFLLAVTASKQWKTDPFISLLIPIAMLYPDLLAVLESGTGLSFAGLPVQTATYHASVIPVLLGVGLLCFVEKPCDRWIPEAVRGFLKPIVCCLIVLPVTFILFGPIGTWIGNGLTAIFQFLYSKNQIAAGMFMGFLIQPMVVVGAHWSFVPVCINSISVNGYDTILPLLGGAVYGQAGAALAMAVIFRKNKEKRRTCLQAALSGALGVTEPVLFGVTIAEPRAMVAACLAGMVGGGIAGGAGSVCTSFAFPGFLTCIAYVGPGFRAFLFSMIFGFLLGFAFTIIQGKWIAKKEIPADKRFNP